MVAQEYKESQVRKVKLEKRVKRVKVGKEENKAFRESKDHKYVSLLIVASFTLFGIGY